MIGKQCVQCDALHSTYVVKLDGNETSGGHEHQSKGDSKLC